jgi:hypothetical protein
VVSPEGRFLDVLPGGAPDSFYQEGGEVLGLRLSVPQELAAGMSRTGRGFTLNLVMPDAPLFALARTIRFTNREELQ